MKALSSVSKNSLGCWISDLRGNERTLGSLTVWVAWSSSCIFPPPWGTFAPMIVDSLIIPTVCTCFSDVPSIILAFPSP